MTENYGEAATSHLDAAENQLEHYYERTDFTDEDRALCLREAEVNALLAIGHALTDLAQRQKENT